jgi:hypothetical protein
LFARKGIALEMIPIDGGAANMVLALTKARSRRPYGHSLSHRGRAQGFRHRRNPGRNRNADYSLIAKPTVPALPKRSRAGTWHFTSIPDRGVVPKQGEIDVKGFAQVIQVMAEAVELAPPLPLAVHFIDLQYLKAAGLQ